MKTSLKVNLETLTLKSFLRGFMAVGVFVLILTGVVIQKAPFKLRLSEGDVVLKSIYAPYDFVYTGAPDEIKTQAERQKAKMSVREIYSINPQVASDDLIKLDKILRSPQTSQDVARLSSEIKDLLRSIYSR